MDSTINGVSETRPTAIDSTYYRAGLRPLFTIYPNVLKQMRRGFGLGHTSGLFPAGSSEGTAFLADDRPL